MSCAELDRDLDAFVDRELAADADAAFRAHLRTCRRCSDRVGQRQDLSRLVRSLPYYEAPLPVRARAARAAARLTLVRRFSAVAAAAALMLAAGAGAFTLVARTARLQAARVVDAHVAALASGHVFEVRSTDQHTVKPWFQGKLDYSPPVTDLESIGFALVGGRVERLDGRPVAALVYQRKLHIVTVFVTPARATAWPRPGAYTIRGFHVRRWTADDMEFWAVSDLNEAELGELARALGN